MLRRLSISAKIWASVGAFALGYVASTILGQINGVNVESDLAAVSGQLLPAVQQAQEADTAFQKMVKGFSMAVMTQDSSLLGQAAQQGEVAAGRLRSISGATSLAAASRRQAELLSQSVDSYLADARSLYGAALSRGALNRDTEERMQGLASRTEDLRTAVEAQREPVLQELHRRVKDIQTRSRGQRITALVVFAITLLSAIVLVSLTIRRSIVLPIAAAIRGVREAADLAAGQSQKMAESGETVARDAQEQASSVHKTSSALDEISATAKENAARATEADTLMKEARQRVEAAVDSMQKLTASMNAISASSNEVAQVLKSIDEIAFHTNILALNAAVEAARAGEVGAGFSVVAGEVRSLAQRAAEAACRSAEIVERTIEDVRSGVDLVSETRGSFEQVSAVITQSSRVVGQIACSSENQSQGVDHIGQAISSIQRVTRNNAENARQTADSAAHMGDQVSTTREHLAELMEVLGLKA